MNNQDFMEQYMCHFGVDIEWDHMLAKMEDYFRTTETMNDRDARSYWIRLFQYETKSGVQKAKIEGL